MVKVQQPKPKSLNKLDKAESNGIKKKSIEKSKKSAGSLNSAKTQKKLLIEKEVKVGEIVEPVKKDKKSKKENVSEKAATATKTEVSKGNEKKKSEKASAKKNEKSLALAPPESSVPDKNPVKGGKEKKAGKAPLIMASPESPEQAIKPVENKKEKKAGKKPLILAPPEAPSPAPVEKVAKIKKEKKVGKAPFILAPPESPGQAIKPVENQKGKKVGKRPLILAPPESPSPAPVEKVAKIKKEKKVGKAPLILAPPESPGQAIKPVENQKGKKVGKRPLILAPPESPSPAPVEKVTKIKKEEKVGKAPLILAPPESPSPVPAKKAPKEKKIQKAPLILAPPESPAPAPATITKTKNDKKMGKKSLNLAPPEPPVQAPAPKAAKPTPVLKTAKENNIKPTAKVPTASAPLQTESATPAAKTTKPRQSKAAIKKAKKAAEATNEGVASPVKKAVKTSDDKAKPLSKKQKTNRVKRAYMKEKRARKLNEQSGDDKKSKKKRTVTYEPVEFDETKFQQIVNLENVKKIAVALKAQVADEVKKQKTSIFSDFRYFLSVASFKIANVPRRMVKLSLKHSLVGEDDDVAIIVPDLQRGAKVDYDPTIQHYEDLFREAGVERLKIIPFNQLRNEMNSFETKHKFCNTYDYYLCDGRLSGQAHALLGSCTQKPRAVLHTVRLVKENLKSEIERGLCRTAYRQLQKGDLISIPIGNYHFTEEQIAENILSVVEQLKTLYAGGHANVRSMHLKIDIKGTSSLPLYISISMPPADTPYMIGPREQRMLKLKSDANKVLAQFTLTKDATFIKLDPTQVENKRKLREAHAALTQNGGIITEDQDAGENIAVPAKKARIEENAKNKDEKPQTDEDKENLGVVDDDDDDGDNEDNSSEEENENESIEEDEQEEDEEDNEEDEEEDDEESEDEDDEK